MPRYERTLKFFFFNDTATTEIYTLSLHDALPISIEKPERELIETARLGERIRERCELLRHDLVEVPFERQPPSEHLIEHDADRKSTRLNSSHLVISYAVFCLKKKKTLDFAQSCTL